MSLSGKKIFITGGAGFIGSHLTESLVKAGAKVTVFDNFSSGLKENLKSVEKDVKIIRGNVLNFDALKKAMKGNHIVSHQAAQLEITKCVKDPIDDLKSNTVGTLNVLRAAVECKVEKLMNASSACVYGQPVYTPSDETNHPTRPNWAYGVSKLAGEKYAQIFTDLYKMPTVSFRYAIMYGEREWYGRVLTIFLRSIRKKQNPVVFGEGEQLRDFTYVGDLVRLHNLALEDSRADGQVFNISTGIGTSIRELAEKAVSLFGDGLSVEFEQVKPGERSKKVRGRMRLPSELSAMVLANGKAKELLGWEPQVMLDDGLKREFEWLSANPKRWTKMSY
jgi:UDP-glucose 4-epimerase